MKESRAVQKAMCRFTAAYGVFSELRKLDEKLREAGENHNCPDCRKGTMRFKSDDHIEPHGEPVHEEWCECDACGFIDRARA